MPHMRRLISAVLFCLLLTPAAVVAQESSDKPVVVGGIRNAANPRPVPESRPSFDFDGVASGSIFVVFGTDLGPQDLVEAAVPYPNQLPAGAGGTRVTFRSLENGETFEAPLLHAWHTQVSGIVPSQVPLGAAEVIITFDGRESDPVSTRIVETRASLFSVNQSGSGPGVIQNYESPSSQPLNSLTQPAAPGQYLILWGTGLGGIEGPDNIAPPFGNLGVNVEVRIGDVSVPVQYAGRAPGIPGVDQINVMIPDDGSIELGCYVEVKVRSGVRTTSGVTMAISDRPGRCDHPWGLPQEKLEELDQGGTATLLTLHLVNEGIFGKIAKVDTFVVERQRGSGVSPFRSLLGSGLAWARPPCLQAFTFALGTPLTDPPPAPTPVPLRPGYAVANVGESVRLIGPDQRAIDIDRSHLDPTAYRPSSDIPEDFFIPGEWRLRSQGGEDAPPFETSFRIAPVLDGSLPAAIQTGTDIEIQWDPADYQEDEVVWLNMSTISPGSGEREGRALSCLAVATGGTMTISAADIEHLEVSAGDELGVTLSVNGDSHVFTAPGIDHGRVTPGQRVGASVPVVE